MSGWFGDWIGSWFSGWFGTDVTPITVTATLLSIEIDPTLRGISVEATLL